jgi:tRNA A22 N-methylase
MQLENVFHFINTNTIIDTGKDHKYIPKPLDKRLMENKIFLV